MPITDFTSVSQRAELWCPVITTLQPREVELLVDRRQINRAASLGVQIFCVPSNTPSFGTSHLNFWGLFRLLALKELGPFLFLRRHLDDTFNLWQDLIEAVLEHHFSGKLSVEIASLAVDQRFHDRTLIDLDEWDLLSRIFVTASEQMAGILCQHHALRG